MKTPEQQKERLVYTVKELADAMQVSSQLVYSLLRQQKLTCVRIGQRRLVIPVRSVRQLLGEVDS